MSVSVPFVEYSAVQVLHKAAQAKFVSEGATSGLRGIVEAEGVEGRSTFNACGHKFKKAVLRYLALQGEGGRIGAARSVDDVVRFLYFAGAPTARSWAASAGRRRA